MNRFIPLLLAPIFVACGMYNQNLEKPSSISLEQIELPAGFKIETFADSIVNARSLAIGDQGTIFVGSRSAGNVYAVVDTNRDRKADLTYTLAEGLNTPNGVAFRNGDLYVAEIDKIWKYPNIESQLASPPTPELITDNLPSDAWHGWKNIQFGPDDKLYVPVGAPCNICEEEDERYATILRMNPDGSEQEVYAKGVRNSVGMDWHPETQALWFTDNGRDMLGDDLPPDELNHAPEQGMHFGFPYCHAGSIPDPQYGEKAPCSDFTAPAQNLHPHGAALGMIFYQGDMFPEAYRNQILICEHGSWNRSELIGYQVSIVKLSGDRAVSFEPFAAGWLKDGKANGRPVDIVMLDDGSLLVSDDHADAIYRISYADPTDS
ncbi:sorbosone dehydrogenase family protein [Pontibacter sp. G13]|uniref:PQQ-dependent sugar dehydrogenase n=1 Tax=Pontibacter sp. G13 TaxID=3074898 RepID=UPI00288C329E|nr:sorbosone dehydrogenase family protein [Pontibacter sp. G13]WNJ16788.1 sorbosone dehydrogenase family protein [Pontibacter sp. G13]